jgi:hypothetical protein
MLRYKYQTGLGDERFAFWWLDPAGETVLGREARTLESLMR